MSQVINEEMHLEKEWFEEAKKQTVDILPQFINHIMSDYQHDYGTICHAIAAAALAATYAADNTPRGGITGFQASFVMWDYIKQWMKPNNECGLKLIDYDDMLYPQYEYKYEKTISSETWRRLQEEAAKNLKEVDYAVNEVCAHWQSIVDGKIPFGYKVKDN